MRSPPDFDTRTDFLKWFCGPSDLKWFLFYVSRQSVLEYLQLNTFLRRSNRKSKEWHKKYEINQYIMLIFVCVCWSQIHFSQFPFDFHDATMSPPVLANLKSVGLSNLLYKIRRTNKIRRTILLTADLHKIRRTNTVPWYIPWNMPSR
jgi:hypothetical protein